MRRLSIIAFAVLLVLPSCEDDPNSPAQGGQGVQTFLPLTSRDAVVNNLELAWNWRNSDEVNRLLDDDFVFYFAPGDVGQGLPEVWGRAEELTSTRRLFESNEGTPMGPVCRSIRFDVDFGDGITWSEMLVPTSAGDEAWYTATLSYAATFEMEPDHTYIISPGSQLQFTVRPEGDLWRLVELRDLGGSGLAGLATGVDVSSWGRIKGLYD